MINIIKGDVKQMYKKQFMFMKDCFIIPHLRSYQNILHKKGNEQKVTNDAMPQFNCSFLPKKKVRSLRRIFVYENQLFSLIYYYF